MTTHTLAPVPPELLDVLTTFVALNAVMFAALAVAKILPKIYVNDWIRWRNERSETRSIHPSPPARERARRRPARIRRQQAGRPHTSNLASATRPAETKRQGRSGPHTLQTNLFPWRRDRGQVRRYAGDAQPNNRRVE